MQRQLHGNTNIQPFRMLFIAFDILLTPHLPHVVHLNPYHHTEANITNTLIIISSIVKQPISRAGKAFGK